MGEPKWAPDVLRNIRAVLRNIGAVEVEVKLDPEDPSKINAAFKVPVSYVKFDFEPPADETAEQERSA